MLDKSYDNTLHAFEDILGVFQNKDAVLQAYITWNSQYICIPWKPVFILNVDIGFLVSLVVPIIIGSPQRGIKSPKYPLILMADAIIGCKQQP